MWRRSSSSVIPPLLRLHGQAAKNSAEGYLGYRHDCNTTSCCAIQQACYDLPPWRATAAYSIASAAPLITPGLRRSLVTVPPRCAAQTADATLHKLARSRGSWAEPHAPKPDPGVEQSSFSGHVTGQQGQTPSIVQTLFSIAQEQKKGPKPPSDDTRLTILSVLTACAAQLNAEASWSAAESVMDSCHLLGRAYPDEPDIRNACMALQNVALQNFLQWSATDLTTAANEIKVGRVLRSLKTFGRKPSAPMWQMLDALVVRTLPYSEALELDHIATCWAALQYRPAERVLAAFGNQLNCLMHCRLTQQNASEKSLNGTNLAHICRAIHELGARYFQVDGHLLGQMVTHALPTAYREEVGDLLISIHLGATFTNEQRSTIARYVERTAGRVSHRNLSYLLFRASTFFQPAGRGLDRAAVWRVVGQQLIHADDVYLMRILFYMEALALLQDEKLFHDQQWVPELAARLLTAMQRYDNQKLPALLNVAAKLPIQYPAEKEVLDKIIAKGLPKFDNKASMLDVAARMKIQRPVFQDKWVDEAVTQLYDEPDPVRAKITTLALMRLHASLPDLQIDTVSLIKVAKAAELYADRIPPLATAWLLQRLEAAGVAVGSAANQVDYQELLAGAFAEVQRQTPRIFTDLLRVSLTLSSQQASPAAPKEQSNDGQSSVTTRAAKGLKVQDVGPPLDRILKKLDRMLPWHFSGARHVAEVLSIADEYVVRISRDMNQEAVQARNTNLSYMEPIVEQGVEDLSCNEALSVLLGWYRLGHTPNTPTLVNRLLQRAIDTFTLSDLSVMGNYLIATRTAIPSELQRIIDKQPEEVWKTPHAVPELIKWVQHGLVVPPQVISECLHRTSASNKDIHNAQLATCLALTCKDNAECFRSVMPIVRRMAIEAEALAAQFLGPGETDQWRMYKRQTAPHQHAGSDGRARDKSLACQPPWNVAMGAALRVLRLMVLLHCFLEQKLHNEAPLLESQTVDNFRAQMKKSKSFWGTGTSSELALRQIRSMAADQQLQPELTATQENVPLLHGLVAATAMGRLPDGRTVALIPLLRCLVVPRRKPLPVLQMHLDLIKGTGVEPVLLMSQGEDQQLPPAAATNSEMAEYIRNLLKQQGLLP